MKLDTKDFETKMQKGIVKVNLVCYNIKLEICGGVTPLLRYLSPPAHSQAWNRKETEL